MKPLTLETAVYPYAIVFKLPTTTYADLNELVRTVPALKLIALFIWLNETTSYALEPLAIPVIFYPFMGIGAVIKFV